MEHVKSKMQAYYEAGNAYYDHLERVFNPPCDCFNPDWEETEDFTADWKDVVTPSVRHMWRSLTGEQQILLSANYATLSRAIETLAIIQDHECRTGEDAREVSVITGEEIINLRKGLKGSIDHENR